MWVAMDPPTQDAVAAGRHALCAQFRRARRADACSACVSGAPGTSAQRQCEFSEARADFTRFPARWRCATASCAGRVVGATIEGQIDYARNDVHLRGTFVPFYGLNNMFGQIPIVGLFLGGGSNEGLLGITYEAVGPPIAPRVTRQSGDGDRARPAAQVHPVARKLRPQFHSADAVAERCCIVSVMPGLDPGIHDKSVDRTAERLRFVARPHGLPGQARQ